MSVGRRTHWIERRVTGPSPSGGEWDHGWHRQSAEVAEAHAREMTAREGVPWARVQVRVVETEIVGETIIKESESAGHRRGR
jgi:hypothetical protein